MGFPELNRKLIPIQGGRTTEELVSDALYQNYRQILSQYSDSEIDDMAWVVPVREKTKTVTIRFDDSISTVENLRLLKVFAADYLSRYSSPTTCKKHIACLKYLFQYLDEKDYRISMLSTAVCKLFHDWLDGNTALSGEKKNMIESSVRVLISFMQGYGMLRPGAILVPEQRKVPDRQPRRSEEIEVMQKMDRYMFDFEHDIPTDIRCRYLLTRMLPLRNSDMNLIRLDGFHIDEGILIISLPTSKETAMHRPAYKEFYLDAQGRTEQRLLRVLRDQQKYAIQQQNTVKDNLRGYLLVSVKNPKVMLSDKVFGDYLKDTCRKCGLTNSLGEPVTITSYSLRHMVGADEMHSTQFTLSDVQANFRHQNQQCSLIYGNYPDSDELGFYDRIFGEQNMNEPCEMQPIILPNRRFQREQVMMNSKLIGYDRICSTPDCMPQYEHCIMECEHYRPDPQYIPDALEVCELLRSRIAAMKLSGKTAFLASNERQLAIYRRYIELAEKAK